MIATQNPSTTARKTCPHCSRELLPGKAKPDPFDLKAFVLGTEPRLFCGLASCERTVFANRRGRGPWVSYPDGHLRPAKFEWANGTVKLAVKHTRQERRPWRDRLVARVRQEKGTRTAVYPGNLLVEL